MHVAPAYDLAIIGGGINGCGIARDAAGRGLAVHLCEMGDLAERHLVALHQADPWRPALSRILRFPPGARGAARARGAVAARAAHVSGRCALCCPTAAACGLHGCCGSASSSTTIWAGVSCCRRLASSISRAIRPAPPLKPGLFHTGFEFSDCRVDDARLVVLNARDAAEHGATIRTRTKAVAAVRRGAAWQVTLEDAVNSRRETIEARALVNAAGPWVEQTIASCHWHRRQGACAPRPGFPHRGASAV